MIFRGFVAALIWLSSCSPPAPSEPVPDDRFWRPHLRTPDHRPSEASHQDSEILSLPWAGKAGPIHQRPAHPPSRLIVNLEASGIVDFRGLRLSLDVGGRARALDLLSRSVAEVNRSLKRRAIHLRCDYRAPWADVRRMIDVFHASQTAIGAFLFAVAAQGEDSWPEARIEAEIADAPNGIAAEKIVLEMGGPPGASNTVARLKSAGRVLSFAAGDPYQKGPANDLANGNWQSLLADLREARSRGVDTVDLSAGDDVPWAYVAMTLGLLLETSIKYVRIEGAPPFHLSTPPQREGVWRRGDRDPRDWPPALALGVGGAIAGLVFALGALTGRRRRRDPTSKLHRTA